MIASAAVGSLKKVGLELGGYGRDLGVNGLQEYQQVKQVNINLRPGVVGWYPHRR